MATSVNSQTEAIMAKDILIAALSGDKKAIHTSADPVKAANEIAAAFEIIFRKIREIC